MTKILNGVSSFITHMTKADAMAPVIALEATVTGGRTIQAYKRGGGDEARERFIEEGTGAVVWLGGVKVLNALGDKILKRKFGSNFDVGTDNVLRTPFDNFYEDYQKKTPKKLSKKTIATMKAGKVLASVLLADAFIGLVVPKINQALTRTLITNKRNKTNNQAQDKIDIAKNQASKNPSFKGGGFSAINVFTNAIENTNTGKLLSTDAGLVSGRMYSARNSTERKEIAIRDIGSIYFYLWAQNHVGNLLNLALTGKADRLDPNMALMLDEHLSKFLESKGGKLSTEEFRKAVLGSNVELPNGIDFKTGKLSSFDKFMNKFRKVKAEPLQVAEVKQIETLNLNKDLMDRIRQMSKLQPERMGEAVVTKQQILDAVNVAEINDPKFLDKVFNKYTDNASSDKYKFVSNKKLYDLKGLMEDYVESVCKKAKNNEITKATLDAARNGNIVANTANFVAGFAVAGAFLSTLIPKFQYWYTKHTTGKDSFPGVYEFEEQEAAIQVA